MRIDKDHFKNTIISGEMPEQLSPPLLALWHDGKGDWKTAHDLIDHLNDRASAHVHAYLHRKEGDLWNADYWYQRAGKSAPDQSLEKEWEELVQLYLSLS
ncbi:hypothetical protein DBR43_15635 [Pedobacter sp. KBW06]|uniref:hypothetical protein n=1 Tax=Pedobacter sp. KBW06 TaxID=2153359 RepID=UPI000F5A654E|nr:hypothetical protein [Pedobacter sp. KBW06]RQO69507.1 hypothetical protein DBR43_15635 [Pedobacter sp. KBW06]